MTERLENLANMCSTKIRVMRSNNVQEIELYCRNVCTGYINNKPCPYDHYKPIGNNEPLRYGRTAFALARASLCLK